MRKSDRLIDLEVVAKMTLEDIQSLEPTINKIVAYMEICNLKEVRDAYKIQIALQLITNRLEGVTEMRCDFCKDTGEVVINEYMGFYQLDICPYCQDVEQEREQEAENRQEIEYMIEDEIDNLIF